MRTWGLGTAGLWVAGLLLAGCSTGADDAEPTPRPPGSSSSPTADVVEVQPGGPGDPSSTVLAVPEDRWNHDDIAFVQMMLPHHRQALDMAALAPDRAADPRVLAIAERVEAAQGPEILVMASLLQEQNVDVPEPSEDLEKYDHAEHGHRGMQGMLSTAEMADLAEASGGDFDRLFLAGMVAHHEGAVDMAADVRRHGSSSRVAELALDVEASQSAEITRMQELLALL